MRVRCRWESHPRSLCVFAQLLHDRLEIQRWTWTGLRTTRIPLSEVVKSEWWTGERDYNFGVYLRDAEPLLLRIHGAARWKFAIDERLVALGREHRGLPRVTRTRVVAAHGTDRAKAKPAPQLAAPVRKSTERTLSQSDSGDHLPEDVELTLGDGGKQSLAGTSKIIVQARDGAPRDASEAEEAYLRVPLAQVRTVRLEHDDRAIRLCFQHTGGQAATVVEVDEDARIELMK